MRARLPLDWVDDRVRFQGSAGPPLWSQFVSGLLLFSALTGIATAQKRNHHSYLGKTPPELESQPGHWLSGEFAPTLEQHRGKVVWLQFNF